MVRRIWTLSLNLPRAHFNFLLLQQVGVSPRQTVGDRLEVLILLAPSAIF
jgi:hypothetical protein